MVMLSDKIKSLRETVGKEYTRPDPTLVEVYEKALQDNPKALEYIRKERGLSDETIKYFHLGYREDYDAIAIPIFKNGELVNFKYRLLNPDKYKYMSESGAETWIYHDVGINEGYNKGRILIVEGEFDLMSAYQAGIKNVISPASGKDSYGVWIEHLDNIPKVYIAYDNDAGGNDSAKKMAERLGVDKCHEVKYPDGVKDANEYFKQHTSQEFTELVKSARPFYKYQFQGLGDVISELRNDEGEVIELDLIPRVQIEKDWLMVISGRSNVGKTTYVLNVADALASQNIPTLIMPFERGITSVGKRFLQVKFEKTIPEFKDLTGEEWDKLTEECLDSPIYFSVPNKNEIVDTIIKARRLFDTRVVIIDHLDYIIRHTQQQKEAEIGDTLQTLKRVAEENGIVIMIVTHIRKIDSAGSMLPKKPGIEDLKGSASLYQDPECVVMLSEAGDEMLNVNIVKNKGEMTQKDFTFESATGRIKDVFDGL